MDHRITPGSSGVPLIPEGTHVRVALATAVLEIHMLTKEGLHKEISREIRFFRGTPGQLEQKAATFGQKYVAGIDEILDSFTQVVGKGHPDLTQKIDEAHRQFDETFDAELDKMADQIHKAPTVEKAQTAALVYLEGPFKVEIETAFQSLAKTMEDSVNQLASGV
ncbi:MAG: hypothetical protein KBC64_03060 [Simkaniaceae bacterium]|nr:hypothetical protein [Simkaniaceae bacterium]